MTQTRSRVKELEEALRRIKERTEHGGGDRLSRVWLCEDITNIVDSVLPTSVQGKGGRR